MKLKPRDTEAFLNRPTAFRVALFFGEDEGLVRERAVKLAKTLLNGIDDPFRATEVTPSDLKEDPSRLLDEALALSFGGGGRVIRLRSVAESHLSAIQSVLESDLGDNRVVIEAGSLPARSKLRQALEKNDQSIVIPCYADAGRDLEGLIREVSGQYGLEIEPQATSYLVSHLGSDRSISRSELEKLALYCHGQGRITVKAAEECVGDSAAHKLDDAVHAAAEGDLPGLERALLRVREEGQSPVAVVRIALSHFQRLHVASDQVARGQSIDQVVKGQRPPLFFKAADRFRAQLSRWRPRDVETALSILFACEIDTKGGAAGADLSAARALLRLALAARKTRNR